MEDLCFGKHVEDKLETEAWGQKKGEEYTERLGNIGDGADDRFTIKKSLFESEVDMLASLRMGKYSSLITFFNHSTGQYEEYVYKVKESYDNMAHLGGQDSLSLIPVCGYTIHHIFAMFIFTSLLLSSYSFMMMASPPWQSHVTRSPTLKACSGGALKKSFIRSLYPTY